MQMHFEEVSRPMHISKYHSKERNMAMNPFCDSLDSFHAAKLIAMPIARPICPGAFDSDHGNSLTHVQMLKRWRNENIMTVRKQTDFSECPGNSPLRIPRKAVIVSDHV
jgi:hypothetical protein